MSRGGYFDRLADRALGRAPILTPRRGARFETLSPAQVMSLEESIERPASTVARSHADPAAVPGPIRQLVAHTPQTAALPPAAPRIETPSLLHEVREHRTIEHRDSIYHLPPETQPLPASTGRDATRRSDSLSESPGVGSTPAAEQGPSAETRIVHLTAESQPAPNSTRDLRDRLDRIENAIARSDERAIAPQAPAPTAFVTPAAAERVTRPVVAYDVRPAASSFATMPRLAPEPAAETTVHVTIGRVDVHAHLERPASAPRTTRAPRLALDEYLRRREGA
jgi:hypothetical protein